MLARVPGAAASACMIAPAGPVPKGPGGSARSGPPAPRGGTSTAGAESSRACGAGRSLFGSGSGAARARSSGGVCNSRRRSSIRLVWKLGGGPGCGRSASGSASRARSDAMTAARPGDTWATARSETARVAHSGVAAEAATEGAACAAGARPVGSRAPPGCTDALAGKTGETSITRPFRMNATIRALRPVAPRHHATRAQARATRHQPAPGTRARATGRDRDLPDDAGRILRNRKRVRRGLSSAGSTDRRNARFRPRLPRSGSTGCISPAGPSVPATRS